MGEDSLTPGGAIAVYRQLASDERVNFAPEPPNIESAWTDAYLAAFALEAGFRLISFDGGMRHWPALALDA